MTQRTIDRVLNPYVKGNLARKASSPMVANDTFSRKRKVHCVKDIQVETGKMAQGTSRIEATRLEAFEPASQIPR